MPDKKAFCNQEEFAKKPNVALSTVNRWEQNKVRPNVKAMKQIKQFCSENEIDYEPIETEWLYPSENTERVRTNE